jgi:hypothetical protein
MLKKLIYIYVAIYVFVIYGQNIFVFGSDLRIEFYFVGMALSDCVLGYILYKSFKNIATSYLLFMFIGELLNQIFFKAQLNYIEIAFGLFGVTYILLEKRLKKRLKKWLRI